MKWQQKNLKVFQYLAHVTTNMNRIGLPFKRDSSETQEIYYAKSQSSNVVEQFHLELTVVPLIFVSFSNL